MPKDKEQIIRQIIEKVDWDLWRESYDDLTFQDQRRIYDELLPIFPQQEGYDASFFLRAFERIVSAGVDYMPQMKVAELGPFRGELAAIVLQKFKVRKWAGYEISRWAVERTRPEAVKLGYHGIAMERQFWDDDLPCFDIFVSSDTIEHFSDEHAREILEVACEKADFLIMQIDCKPREATWKSYEGTHKIEMTTEDIISYLEEKGFVLVERSGIRMFLVSKAAAERYPKLKEPAKAEKKKVPIRPGFRFKCQMCGQCCRESWEVLLSEEEIVRLTEYGIPIHFKKIVKKLPGVEAPRVAVVPVMPKIDEGAEGLHCFCLGDEKEKNGCVIHRFRPATCFRAPMEIYTYRQVPMLKDLRQILDDPEMTAAEALEFITEEKLELGGKPYSVYYVGAASVFLNTGARCPGIGKGDTWTEAEVYSYLKRYGRIFEEHTKSVNATIQKYTAQFAPEFDLHFEVVDADRQIYRARKRSWGDIIK
jgi:Fe-S-cluster containining protein